MNRVVPWAHLVVLIAPDAPKSKRRRLPDESAILQFRHLLEELKLAAHILAPVNDMLRVGTVVDAAPSSPKNAMGVADLNRRHHACRNYLSLMQLGIVLRRA